jgi:hypothetical protein
MGVLRPFERNVKPRFGFEKFFDLHVGKLRGVGRPGGSQLLVIEK